MRLRNPMSEDHSTLRTTLLGSLLDGVRRNRSRGMGDVRLFEVGALVDHKNGRLLQLTKEDQKLTFEYELVSGKKVTEELGVPALYDLWVRIYRRQSPK